MEFMKGMKEGNLAGGLCREYFIFDWVDYVFYGACVGAIVAALGILMRYRGDERFLYRSPNLLISSIVSMLLCQILTGIASCRKFGAGGPNCILGHIDQYVFYPFLFISYMTRALRLVILFKRADIGLYSSESISKGNDESNTIALLKENEDTVERSLRSEDIRKPQATRLIHRMYYWLLWFDTEWQFFLLACFFTLIPIALMATFFIIGSYKVLPVINSSFCLCWIGDESLYTTILIDIIMRNLDCYGIATLYVLLMKVPADFNIKTEVRSILFLLGGAGIVRNSIGIFFFSQEDPNSMHFNRISFYLQTFTFFVSVGISVFIPFLTNKRVIPSLPSSPERIEHIQTAILEPKGFSTFYEWCETNNPNVVKYLDCFVRIRFFKKASDNLEVTKQMREKAAEIIDFHLSSGSDERLSCNSLFPDLENPTPEMFDSLQSECLSVLSLVYQQYKNSDDFFYLYQQLQLEVKQYIILKNRLIP
ncbi:unnamed protein product [Moneuplotes crassus]|uniref:RGS domain-containing protein n=1 Tax=Euplotes crassus TaxID=5936 RepID=A0AAD1UKS5_EUPCR|nr:unnamed protein product [Moneuplotes crassus]